MFTHKIFSNDSIIKHRKEKGLHSGFKVINIDNKREVIDIRFYHNHSKNTGYTTFNCCLWIRSHDTGINVGSKSTGCGYDVRCESLLNACYDAGIKIDKLYDIDSIIDKLIEGLGLNNTITVPFGH
jgi:hypothetical protein